MRRPLLLLAVSVLLLAVVIVIYFISTKSGDDITADNSITGDEDYFADNITLIKYTKTGALYYEMQGVHITHHDTNDIAFVTNPTMTLYTDKKEQWHLKANDGKLYNHKQAVDLTNDVIVSRFDPNKTEPALQLTTNTVTLHPDTNTFTTGDDVTIKTDSTHTTATGMKANLNTNNIELLNNVRSYYGGK